MPVIAYVNGKGPYPSTNSKHAELSILADKKFENKNLQIDMNAWPCVDRGFLSCHESLIRACGGRTITVNISDDHGGYAVDHPGRVGAAAGQKTGVITYTNGGATYS